MSETNTKKSVAQLAAEGDPAAIEYLKWIKLRRDQENLKARLSQTADVPDKFRESEYLKAKEEYTGSASDVARRALEATAVPGNVIKAAIKPSEDPDLTRVDQIANAIKAVTGSPEKAFREQQVRGEDILKNADMSAKDKALLGAAIDMGADLAGMAGAVKGTQALGKGAVKGAEKVSQTTRKVYDKVLPPQQTTMGSIDLPQAKPTVVDNVDLYELAENQQLQKKLLENQAQASKELRQALDEKLAGIKAKKQGIVDEQKMLAEEAADKLYKQRTKERALQDIAKKEESLLSPVDQQKMIKELEETSSPLRQSEELLERMSKASEEMPTLDSRASEILAEKMSKASDNIPEIVSSPTILQPNTPITSSRLVKGLEKYGTSESAKALKEKQKLAEQLVKKARKKK